MHGADGETAETPVVGGLSRTIGQVAARSDCILTVGTLREERGGPVRIVIGIEKRCTIDETSGGNEDTIAIGSLEVSTGHTIERGVNALARGNQFVELLVGRHTPFATPLGLGSIILGQEHCEGVGLGVLGLNFVFKVIVFIGIPATGEGIFGSGFTPGEIGALLLGTRSAEIARRPLDRKTEVNSFGNELRSLNAVGGGARSNVVENFLNVITSGN